MRISDWSSDVCSSDLTVSLSLADALSVPGNGLGRAHWRERLREYCDEINIVPDLGQRIGSAEWLRGVLTCGPRCASALYLSPGFAPIPGLEVGTAACRERVGP